MHYRKLGHTGCMVGEIGFGGWSLAAPPPDDDTAVAMLRLAIERGANFIDTAGVYGAGRSERLIGLALEGRREHALIATKGGLVHRDGTLERDFSPDHMDRTLRESLERLQCTYIDVFQLHYPTVADLHNPALWETLERMKADKLIRHVGVVTTALEVALAAVDEPRVETVQIVLNVLDATMLPVLTRARAAGVGVIVRAPLLAGMLAGSFKSAVDGDSWPLSDPRREWSGERLKSTSELVERFARTTTDGTSTLAQSALGWALGNDGVSVTIPGARNPAQLEENVAASDLPPPSARQMVAVQHLQLTSAVP
jgi:aryl-alcohol dehydrogenase-like predicted oxidoreductase